MKWPVLALCLFLPPSLRVYDAHTALCCKEVQSVKGVEAASTAIPWIHHCVAMGRRHASVTYEAFARLISHAYRSASFVEISSICFLNRSIDMFICHLTIICEITQTQPTASFSVVWEGEICITQPEFDSSKHLCLGYIIKRNKTLVVNMKSLTNDKLTKHRCKDLYRWLIKPSICHMLHGFVSATAQCTISCSPQTPFVCACLWIPTD